MNGCHRLMQPQHDHRQPQPAKDKTGESAPLIDCRRCGSPDTLRNNPADWLQNHNGQHPRNQHHKQRGQEQIEHLRNDPVQLLFEPGGQCCNQQYRNNATPARRKRIIPEDDLG